MLFGVPDEITDVMRVSGMVWKRILIYRMVSFGHRKVSVNSDSVPGVTNEFQVFTGRGPPTRESSQEVYGAT